MKEPLKATVRVQSTLHGKNGISMPAMYGVAAGMPSSIAQFSTSPSRDNSQLSDEHIKKVTSTALIHELNLRQMETSNKVVPWFFENMPPSYFRQVNEELRKQHLTVLCSAQELGQSDLTVKISHATDADTREVTFVSVREPSAEPVVGSLAVQLNDLEAPPGMHLNRVKVFSSKDHSISVNIFTFESEENVLSNVGSTRADAARIMDLVDQMKAGTVPVGAGNVPTYDEDLFGEKGMDEYLSKVTPMYCETSTPNRFLTQREMFDAVQGTDNTEIRIEKSKSNTSTSNRNGTWFTLVSANIMPQDLLKVSSAILASNGLSVDRAHLDTVLDDKQVNDGTKSYVTMLRLLVEDHPLLEDASALAKLGRHLKRGKWIDEDVFDLGLNRRPELGVDRAEVLHGLYSMLHGVVAAQHQSSSFASVKNMHRLMESSDHMFSISGEVAQLFIDRFKPEHLGGNLTEAEYQSRVKDLKHKIELLHHEACRILLLKCVEAVDMTLKTNFFHEERYSFGLRVDPRLMVDADKAQPYGVIFASGRNFQFFHNRFRDIARGGLRVVTPPNAEQHGVESSRVYGECYGLSWAQQLKNKDIPEGGSKAVCLVNTPRLSPEQRYGAARIAVRASVDAILDLTVDESTQRMKDHFGKQEVIFLGPDEQVVPSDCNWICHRAGQRGYPMPMAFMSSKPEAGINHKEYGVTSEGVAVYLEVALKEALGIDPRKDSFSVKITGGPDGDVGGNLIKILFREFPDTCKVVGVADGMGVAEDPDGLDGKELVRLFYAEKPITYFDKTKLGPNGICMEANSDEGIERRNTMVFRVKADAFVPAGGRPATINSKNWHQFCDENGKPSSPLIVEGANIFTTPEARDLLFEKAGVAIVKDSSANKCGVVTSSCEVAASMLLSTEEFLANKPEVVEDVIKRLHIIAKAEAELLFREYKNFPGALPHFSERISNAINLVTDAITTHLENVNPGDKEWDELMPLVKDNLPVKLADVAWDRAPDRFPLQYMKNSMASTLASRLVYQEGIHVIEAQPENRLAERAIHYYRASNEIKALMEEIAEGQEKGELSEEAQARVIALLQKGGTRSSCDFF